MNMFWATVLYPYTKVKGNFSYMDSLRKRDQIILIYNGAFYPVYTLGL